MNVLSAPFRWSRRRRSPGSRPVPPLPDPEIGSWRLTRPRVVWLTASLVLVIAPHLPRLPLWVGAGFGLLVAWRLVSAVGRPPRPPPTSEFAVTPVSGPQRWMLSAIALALIAGVFVTFGTLLGRDAGVAMLTLLAAVKLMETRTMRDAYTACFLGYFLVVTNFLYDQSIPTGVYMIVVVVVLTATLRVVATHERTAPDAGTLRTRLARQLRDAGAILLQALPIMLALFVLFPRVPGPLWGLPKDAHGGVSGLSDRMRPGAISELSLSNAVAFRVSFDGAKAPDSRTLYWRGPVFWDTDGTTWDSSKPYRPIREQVELKALGTPVAYTVTLEPHQQRWLFTLEMPVKPPAGAYVNRDLEVLNRRPVNTRMRYSATSSTAYGLGPLAPMERKRALALPDGRHAQARALAATWRVQAQGDKAGARARAASGDTPNADRAIVERALAHFRDQPFHYTLRPPPLLSDPVDEFLFDTRRGFCEHYASSFAVLMRAAGIPARIVTGYQGGDFNPVGSYLIVRQRDAHAWAEVYLDGEGWVRVDPTAAVAPSRIEAGMDAAIPETFGAGALTLEPSEGVMKLWRSLRRRADAVNNAWNQWVLGYGPENQGRLLRHLGLDARDFGKLTAVLCAVVFALFASVALWLGRRRKALDPAARAYEQFCRKLAGRGVTRAMNEGPLDYAARVAAERPQYASAAARVTALYVGLRYAPGGSDPERLGALRRAVATL